MKNYSKVTPKKDFGSTALKSNQSLFMDESSDDLENYLNTPLTKSSATGGPIQYPEQDLECSTMNALSRNIKGRFQRDSKGARKNKFFKSKSLEEKTSVNSNEIPVIDEAMKKFFKETPYTPNPKCTPKALKTYSNKHKNQSTAMESFSLPDRPFVSIDTSHTNEQDSIDLDIKADEESYDISCLFGSWIHPNQKESSEININEEFRRKSDSIYTNTSLQIASLEAELKDGFNFEEDALIQQVEISNVQSSNVDTMTKRKRCPVVSLKPLNLNDNTMLEANNLSPSKNRKDLLFERWENFNTKFNKTKPTDINEVSTANTRLTSPKVINPVENKTHLRRSTRSNNSSVVSQGSNVYPNDSSDIGPLPLNDISLEQVDQKHEEKMRDKTLDTSSFRDIVSPRRSLRKNHIPLEQVDQKHEEKMEDKTLDTSPFEDIVSPRRSLRKNGQQVGDSQLVNTNKEKHFFNSRSPIRKIGDIKKDNPKVSPLKGQRFSICKQLNEGIAADESLEASPTSNMRDVRLSLRSSNSHAKSKIHNESSCLEQQFARNGDVKNENIVLEKRPEKLPIEKSTLVNESAINVCSNKKTSATNKSSRRKNTNNSQNCVAHKRKSNRLQSMSDKIADDPTEPYPSKNLEETEIDSHNSSLNEMEKKSENLIRSIDQEIGISPISKRKRGRRRKNVLLVTSETIDLNTEAEWEASKTSREEASKTSREEDSKREKSDLKEVAEPSDAFQEKRSKMNDTTPKIQHMSNEEITHCGVELSKFNGVDITCNPMNEIGDNDKSESKKEENTSKLCVQKPLRRKRGRPRKSEGLKLHDTPSKVLNEIEKRDFDKEKSDKNDDENKTDKSVNGIKNVKKILDNIDKTNETKIIEKSSEVLNCEEIVEFEMKEYSHESLSDNITENAKEMIADAHFAEKQISEVITEPLNGFKRNLNESTSENIGKLLDSIVEESSIFEKLTKTEEALDDAKEKKTNKTEFESIYLESCKKNYGVNCKLMGNEMEKVKESHLSKSLFDEKSSSEKTNITNHNAEIELNNTKAALGYSDFGYDVTRRMSFRKILERVMEASRLELTETENSRIQRCKSVPHEHFHSSEDTNHICTKALSADSKFNLLKNRKNSNVGHMDISTVKRCLDYNMEPNSQERNLTIRKRTKSMYIDERKSMDTIIYPDVNTFENGRLEGIKSSLSKFSTGQKKNISNDKNIAEISTNTNNCNDNREYNEEAKLLSKDNVISENSLVLEQTINTDFEESTLNQEAEDLLSDKMSDQFYERRRCKSFSGASRIEKLKTRSVSVIGRKIKKKNKKNSGEERPSSRAARKVYEFNIGDTVWAKLGNYPYWPGLIVKDPETSEFKKFRLLRATPYYHVRFFGDNGKRAWTSYCIPYEGPEDLNILMEKSQGIPTADLVVKSSIKQKWSKAVEEAELVKNSPLEDKLGFFDRIFPIKGNSEISEKVKDSPTVGFKRVRSKSFSCSSKLGLNEFKMNSLTQKEKIPMKLSSLLSCIDDVVKNSSQESTDLKNDTPPSTIKKSLLKDNSAEEVLKNSESNEDGIELKKSSCKSPLRKKSSPMKDSSVLSAIDDVVKKYCPKEAQESKAESSKKKMKQSLSQPKDGGCGTDVGLELLDIPAPNLELKTQTLNEKSPIRNSTKQSTTIETPLSSRRDTLVSPKRRTRSKSSLRLQRRKLSKELEQDEMQEVSDHPKVSMELSSSPRQIKLKRRTIAVCQTSSENSESDRTFLDACISRLPEYKKNLFRGVPKERVCQICEKPGEVVKCRGPCNGDFHVECIEESLKKTEELTLKQTEEVAIKQRSDDVNWQTDKQVEISTVESRKKFADNVILSPANNKVPLMEQIDRKMKELMNQVESQISVESNGSSSEEIDVFEKTLATQNKDGKNSKKRKSCIFKHVTADDVREIHLSDTDISVTKSDYYSQISNGDEGIYKCAYCVSTVIPPCFVCNSVLSKKGNTMRQRCSLQKCGRYYHLECLNFWHQTQWSFILHDKRKTEAFDSFVCPRHSCHICASENSGYSTGRCPNGKLVKCLRCPATYHNSYHCVPAGTDILSSTQIVCPRHVEGNKSSNTLNTIWCFVCSEGGNLICCETCPTSVHAECLQVNLLEDDTYICEDCESGRFPLYDEVVWVKCGTFRWWPAIILFPNEVPANVESKAHSKGEFVVKFFGTYNYFWVGRGRTFLYQEGDTGCLTNTKNKIDEAFSRALREAADVFRSKKGLRAKKQKEVNNGLKPPPYVRIKVNRAVGNVKVFEGNLSNTTPCDCDPRDKNPCGPDSNCLNRILLTECNPEICPAGQKCKNQSFEKREYPNIVPYRTAGRGWGLKTLEFIKKGRFVIEYVGELIDDEEYQRRITRMHQQKDENYYFLTIDKDRMLDAGPKGNVARFMNHSCQPNCETQKWTVNGDTRVGLFAIEDIPIDTELTFNYNLECVGTEKKICRCGAPNCSGFIGVKPDDQKTTKKSSAVKTVVPERQDESVKKESCFICGEEGNVDECSNKTCFRSYHLECVQLDSWPNGKWNCPSHNCNICTKRTSRICVRCNNSYCPFHSEGNIRYDDSLGYLCSEHDQTKKPRRRNQTVDKSIEANSNDRSDSPKKNDASESTKSESLRSERYRKRTSCSETSNPRKKIKLDKE